MAIDYEFVYNTPDQYGQQEAQAAKAQVDVAVAKALSITNGANLFNNNTDELHDYVEYAQLCSLFSVSCVVAAMHARVL